MVSETLSSCPRENCSLTPVLAGLTVPFALTAGLSSLGSSRLVYTAGVAELVSGALSMGVGGYLSAQAERDHYRYLRKQTRVSLQITVRHIARVASACRLAIRAFVNGPR